jgi:hypothetical protein
MGLAVTILYDSNRFDAADHIQCLTFTPYTFSAAARGELSIICLLSLTLTDAYNEAAADGARVVWF